MAVAVAAVARRHVAAHTLDWERRGGGRRPAVEGIWIEVWVELFFDKRGRVDGGVVGGVGADAGGSVGFITRATTIDLVVAWVYNPRYYYDWSRETRWKSLSSREG